jgi:hypothetical protein
MRDDEDRPGRRIVDLGIADINRWHAEEMAAVERRYREDLRAIDRKYLWGSLLVLGGIVIAISVAVLIAWLVTS